MRPAVKLLCTVPVAGPWAWPLRVGVARSPLHRCLPLYAEAGKTGLVEVAGAYPYAADV